MERLLTLLKTNKHIVIGYYTKCSLFGDCPELAWHINELLTDVVCKLKDSDKVANAKAKAHRDGQHQRKSAEKKYVERK